MYNDCMKNILDPKKIKILWLGTPKISAIVLKKLIESGYNICGVVCSIDKPVGRKQEILPVPTKKIALENNIPVYQPIKIRLDYDFVKEINPDLILCMAYGQIIPQGLLDIPKFGCLNLHGSLLPKYRGAAPMQFALLNGDEKTGVTLMQMVDKMDAGKIYLKKEFSLNDEDNLDTLILKMADAAYKSIEEGLSDYINGINSGIEQDENLVTFTSKIKPEDQIISFENKAVDIKNKIRALTSEPGAYFIYKNESYKVSSSKVVDIQSNPGEIVSYDKYGLTIGTLEKSISFTSIQKPGKKMIKISDFINGNKNLFVKGEIVK